MRLDDVLRRNLLTAAERGDLSALRYNLETASLDQINRPYDFLVTLLHAAAHQGHAECLRALCVAGAALDTKADFGVTPIHDAALQGHADCVATLCEAGAAIDIPADQGMTPLYIAATEGHSDCVRVLCEAGARVNHVAGGGVTSLYDAARQGHTFCVHLLSSYGARDERAAAGAARHGHADLATWLRDAKAWTPLHHLEVLTPARALSLLRDGADLHAGSPSPLERARTVPGEVSALVVHAGRQWSPQTHHLFPAAARSYAVEVLRLGYLLAWSPRYTGEASSLVDVWLGYVLPHAVERI